MCNNKELKDLADNMSCTFQEHLDFISDLNEKNPRLAAIFISDFAFHLKFLSILKKSIKNDDSLDNNFL